MRIVDRMAKENPLGAACGELNQRQVAWGAVVRLGCQSGVTSAGNYAFSAAFEAQIACKRKHPRFSETPWA
jgi:hypothetical protein